MHSKPVSKDNKTKKRKTKTIHDLFNQCNHILRRLLLKNQEEEVTTYSLSRDLYKIGQTEKQTGLRYKVNVIQAIKLLTQAQLITKKRKGKQKGVINLTKMGEELALFHKNIEEFVIPFQKLEHSDGEITDDSVYDYGKSATEIDRSSELKYKAPYEKDWDLDELKWNALNHFVVLILMKFFLLMSNNNINKKAISVLKEIVLLAISRHSELLSKYLINSREVGPNLLTVKSHLDVVIHRAVYDVIGPINKKSEQNGIELLRSLLSIIVSSEDELFTRVEKEKNDFSDIIRGGYIEVTRDYSHKDIRYQMLLYDKLLHRINSSQV